MHPLLVIIGPTAAGKTAAALRIAEHIGGEIVSADSQQVYRGMDIGTGKATAEERARVPHHLIDIVPPSEVMTAARWQALADEAIAGIVARGRLPIVTGGTGLYVRALLRGLFDGPGADDKLRGTLEDEARAKGVETLHDRLHQVDPHAAAKIERRDLRRIVRALEVQMLTGTPISVHQQKHDYRNAPLRYAARVVGIAPPRDVLRTRIDTRVDSMITAGLVAEVKGLEAAGYDLGNRAFDAIGYREVRAHLSGQLSLVETTEAIKAATRRYAKRQLTWFRDEPGVTWYISGAEVEG